MSAVDGAPIEAGDGEQGFAAMTHGCLARTIRTQLAEYSSSVDSIEAKADQCRNRGVVLAFVVGTDGEPASCTLAKAATAHMSRAFAGSRVATGTIKIWMSARRKISGGSGSSSGCPGLARRLIRAGKCRVSRGHSQREAEYRSLSRRMGRCPSHVRRHLIHAARW